MSEKPIQGGKLPRVDVEGSREQDWREASIQLKTEHGMNYLKHERNEDLSSPDYIPEYIQGPLFENVRDAHRLFVEFSTMEEQAVRGSKEQMTLAREKEKQVKRVIKIKEQLETYKASTLGLKEALGAMSKGTQDSNVFTNMVVFGGQSDVVDFDEDGNMLFSVVFGSPNVTGDSSYEAGKPEDTKMKAGKPEDTSVFRLNDMADVYNGGSPIVTEPFQSKMDIWSLAEETKASQIEGKDFEREWMYKRLINDFTNKGANNTIGLAFADLAGDVNSKSFAEQWNDGLADPFFYINPETGEPIIPGDMNWMKDPQHAGTLNKFLAKYITDIMQDVYGIVDEDTGKVKKSQAEIAQDIVKKYS